jgi:PRTRC genetic system protein E
MLAKLHPTGNWIINASSTGEKMVVSVLLSQGQIGKNLPPMVFAGSPDELDEGFYCAIESPVHETATLFLNLAEHQKSLESATQALKEKAQAKTAREAVGAGNKKSFEDMMKKVQELSALCRYREALAILPAPEDYPDKTAEIEKTRVELDRKNAQLNLL